MERLETEKEWDKSKVRPGFEEFFDCLKTRYSNVPQPIPPPADTSLSAVELAKLIEPRDQDHSPFKAYQDVSMYEKLGDYVAPGRRSQNLYEGNENVFQKEVQLRISNGDIDKDTLVVAITGHGPTIGYEMAKRFGSDIFTHHNSEQENDFNMKSIKLPQMQTFAKSTHDVLASKPREGASTLLDVDLHLFEPSFSWSSNDKLTEANLLPKPDELWNLGVKKLLLLEERAPKCTGKDIYTMRQAEGLDGRQPWLNPLFEWLNSLKKDGRFVMNEDGIDARVHL